MTDLANLTIPQVNVFDLVTLDQYNQLISDYDQFRMVVYKDYASVLNSIDVQVEDQTITITTNTPTVLNDTGGLVGEKKTTITWDQLKNDSTYSGFDRWILNADKYGNHEPIFNLYPQTAVTKQRFSDFIKNNVVLNPTKTWNSFFQLVTIPEASSFKQCFFSISGGQNTNITSNITQNVQTQRFIILTPGYETKRYYYPNLGARFLNQNADGGQIIVGVPNNAVADIYITSDYGITPNKVALNNGRATFNFSSAGMTSGETATIKFGFKWFSSIFALTYTKP